MKRLTYFGAKGKSLYKDDTEILELLSNEWVILNGDFIDDKVNSDFKQRVL